MNNISVSTFIGVSYTQLYSQLIKQGYKGWEIFFDYYVNFSLILLRQTRKI